MVSANPTGPITVASARNGAYGDAVARLLEFAGHEVEREYYYNDAGAQMERFRGLGRRGAARGGAAGGRLPGRLRRRAARRSGRPGAADAGADRGVARAFRIHFDSWALQSELEQRLVRAAARSPTYEARGPSGRSKRARRRQGPAARPLAREGRLAHLLRRRHRLPARQARARLRPAIYVLGADHHGYVARLVGGGRADARLRSGARRGAALPARPPHPRRRGRRRCPSAAATWSSSTSFSDEVGVDAARWYLVDRGPDQTIEIDVDLAAETAQKNPSTTSSTRTRGSPGSCATPATRELGRAAAGRWRRRSAASSSGWPTSRRSLREATERRGPARGPEYAIELADDFHRFYHDHRVLGGSSSAFRLALAQRDAARAGSFARPGRRRGAGADVAWGNPWFPHRCRP